VGITCYLPLSYNVLFVCWLGGFVALGCDNPVPSRLAIGTIGSRLWACTAFVGLQTGFIEDVDLATLSIGMEVDDGHRR